MGRLQDIVNAVADKARKLHPETPYIAVDEPAPMTEEQVAALSEKARTVVCAPMPPVVVCVDALGYRHIVAIAGRERPCCQPVAIGERGLIRTATWTEYRQGQAIGVKLCAACIEAGGHTLRELLREQGGDLLLYREGLKP